MKCFLGLEIALGFAKVACCMIWAVTGLLRAESESLPYHLIRFEEDEGYQAGEVKGFAGGLQLLQGDARIVRDEADESGQCLETVAGNPYTSIYFNGERVSRNQQTYYEVWVRPSASELASGEEFMDLDGAVLGFFTNGPDKPASFHAYHAIPEHEGYWVSTGVSAAVGPSGMTREWIRIGICHNLATGTWDLEIGGEAVLTEIRSSETPQKDGIQLWLLGHETHANRFDDLLVSPVEPDSLRLDGTSHLPRGRSIKQGHSASLDRTRERKVGSKQSDEDRRRHDAGIPEDVPRVKPRSINAKIDIIGGGTQHGKFDGKDPASNQSFLLYSPQYAEGGNPLPLKVRIQCDAQLADGVDLSEILWVVKELAKEKGKGSLKVIAHGSFKTGFTQIAEIPSEWANKGTQIEVGTNLDLRTCP